MSIENSKANLFRDQWNISKNKKKEMHLLNTENYLHITALKGIASLMISMFNQKELYEPCILTQLSSKSVEKLGSYEHLGNSIWPTFSRHFEY